MPNNPTPDVPGWLQDAGEYALSLLDGLQNGTLPDMAATGDDWDIEQACRLFIDDCKRYERACLKPRLGDDDSDPGPVKEQRL